MSAVSDDRASYSMFCFAVVRPRTYEVANLQCMLPELESCSGFEIISNESFRVTQNYSTTAVITGSMDRLIDRSWLGAIARNTDIFQQVWWNLSNRNWDNFAWVVKIDADAVVNIERLQALLAPYVHRLSITTSAACNGVLGGLYAIRTQLVRMYKDFHRGCLQNFREREAYGAYYAEDYFIYACLTNFTKVRKVPIQNMMTKGGQTCDTTVAANHGWFYKNTARYCACASSIAKDRITLNFSRSKPMDCISNPTLAPLAALAHISVNSTTHTRTTGHTRAGIARLP
eukprot:CAMPEP_0115836110 /NCGR_PEP_ID=MMETSP0287-20121206/4540_1 /TAXON_ID=412157 /ORGANISM="Chrysochromulina rotalis, Strain UIO044" /LENGTH=286 /DNA_ID=CAMNT_0003289587 /DNA_START=1 /DNA_END=861 /DNA_ORIENTATION=+